jgi:hypothetical protein
MLFDLATRRGSSSRWPLHMRRPRCELAVRLVRTAWSRTAPGAADSLYFEDHDPVFRDTSRYPVKAENKVSLQNAKP